MKLIMDDGTEVPIEKLELTRNSLLVITGPALNNEQTHRIFQAFKQTKMDPPVPVLMLPVGTHVQIKDVVTLIKYWGDIIKASEQAATAVATMPDK